VENKISKDKIIEAALPIFMKKGYKGATMREIAASMGIKAGSLYYHIRSKGEILENIHDVLINGLLEKSERIVADDKISNKKKFELFVEDLLRVMAELRPYATVFFRDYRYLSRYYFKKTNLKRKRYQEFLRQIVENGIDGGEFRRVDPAVGTIGIFGMFMWAHTWINTSGRLRVEEIAKSFCDIIFNGICLR
jgi:AcrR family transcriptional regulator